MLGKMAGLLEALAGRRRVVFDPATLDDPVALRTEWGPAVRGGANFRTHRLVAVDHSRQEFRATAGAILFALIFLVLGLGLATVVTLEQVEAGDWLTVEVLGPLLVGLVFAGVGAGLLHFGTAPIVFDLRQGCFWRGRRDPATVADTGELKHFARLADVHALQIISEYISGSRSAYYSYELNLVLTDGRRINVVDHGDLARLREDAGRLATFLGRPLWDGLGGVVR